MFDGDLHKLWLRKGVRKQSNAETMVEELRYAEKKYDVDNIDFCFNILTTALASNSKAG